MTLDSPALPYAGTSGWSGSDTSRERAVRDDSNGKTWDRQRQTILALASAGPRGLTYQELGSDNGWHHGKSSGVLSALHKQGDITRLAKERRNGCAVYVLPWYTQGRPEAPHGRKNPLNATLAEWLKKDEHGKTKADQDPSGFVAAMRAVTGIGS